MYLLLLLQPYIIDNVDKIELNRYFDKNGSYVFAQTIFYNWNFDTDKFDVVDWRLDKESFKSYPDSIKEQKLIEHRNFYIDLALDKHIQNQVRLYNKRGLKYNIDKEKMRESFIKNYKVKIPPFISGTFGHSELSTPINKSIIFKDVKTQGKYRKITAKEIVETFTTFDPELIDRGFLPQDKRIGLSDPK